MQIYIIDSLGFPLGMIDEAESILWNPKYNDVGECEIYISCNEEYLSMLRRGNYIYRYDDDMFCRIESVEIQTSVENGDYIVATGKDICKILAGRIVRNQITFSGTVGVFIEKVLDDNVIYSSQTHRRIDRFEIDRSNLSEFNDVIDISAFTDDLLQLIIATCKAHNIGFRVSYNMETYKFTFRLYRGKNKASKSSEEYVEFSPDYANILNSKYKEEDVNYKNVVYVGYKSADQNDEKIYIYSYPENERSITREKRREMYVDGTGTSRDITYDELVLMYGSVSKESKTITQGNPQKQVISSVYYAALPGKKEAVATSLQDVVDAGEEPADEKITVTDFTYFKLIRRLAQNALDERRITQSFEGVVDTINTYEYKVNYNLGDIVKVINEYGIGAEAQITEIMESEDAENGFSVEPKFEYLS